ncbi:MAG: D-Ala-D-Ala carboxypeptidase family metallohydrolase [Actinomycetota bacterium]
MRVTGLRARMVIVIALALALQGVAAPAFAYEWTRDLKAGDTGRDVRALNVRLSGWYPSNDQQWMKINQTFGAETTAALKAFQAHYGLTVDGLAGAETFETLNALEDENGSTIHFDYKEFKQNENSRCSAKANAYSDTFGGGMVAPRRVRKFVRRLMWRLEAVRAKGGDNPIGINSGFRSVAYNDCIGGARLSQHMYGTAADNRMADTGNRKQRNLARKSQFHGIGCYATLSHNHFDTRIDNRALKETRYWWWPEQDARGRDLDYAGKPCWGEKKRTTSTARYTTTAALFDAVRAALPGAGSLMPSRAEIEAFEDAGEAADLHGAD